MLFQVSRRVLAPVCAAVVAVAAPVGSGVASRASTPPTAGLIPAYRLSDWRPGVTIGVSGGIPIDRTHLIDVTKEPHSADNTGAADAQPAIRQAVADAAPNDASTCRQAPTG